MSDFPSTVFNQRDIENVSGQVFNSAKKTRLYAEDLTMLGDEVSAIETFLLGSNPFSEPITDGYVDNPSLIFSNGDIIMS